MRPLRTHRSIGLTTAISTTAILAQTLSVAGFTGPLPLAGAPSPAAQSAVASSAATLPLLPAAAPSATAPLPAASSVAAPLPAARVYYLDGAGGGGAIVSWAREFERGLRAADTKFDFENFAWQTGLGASADQAASVEYKRRKAQDLASRITAFHAGHPNVPIHLAGLSAGTAVVLYTLEALPDSCRVESVILVGSSVSAKYDLTRALQRVRDRMYVFTSQKDAVLNVLVPVTGTADREYTGREIAGLCGFKYVAPRAAGEKNPGGTLVHIPWKPEFKKTGNHGGHTDFVKADFVRAEIAPLLVPSRAVVLAQGPAAVK